MPEDALAEREATRLGIGNPQQGMVGKDPDAEEARAAEEGESNRMSQINETGHPHDQDGRDIRQTHEDLVDVQNGQHEDSNGGVIPSPSRRSSVSRVGLLLWQCMNSSLPMHSPVQHAKQSWPQAFYTQAGGVEWQASRNSGHAGSQPVCTCTSFSLGQMGAC